MEQETPLNPTDATPHDAQPAPNGATSENSEAVQEWEAMLKRIAELEKAVQENTEGWQRSRAEFQNYRRRMEKEVKEARDKGVGDALQRILPIFDDFGRAMDNLPDELKAHPWVTGTALILKNIDKVFEEYQITIIDPIGQPFDPNEHQAIGMDTSTDIPSGHVTVTLQKGYKSGDRILRPAIVRVAS